MPRLETLEKRLGVPAFLRWRCGKKGRTASFPPRTPSRRPFGSTTKRIETAILRMEGLLPTRTPIGKERWRSCCCAATIPSLRGWPRASRRQDPGDERRAERLIEESGEEIVSG